VVQPKTSFSLFTRIGRVMIVRSIRALGPLRNAFVFVVAMTWYGTRPATERLRAAENHRRLNPSLNVEQARRLARRSFYEYVAMIVDSIWADALDNEEINRLVTVSGQELLLNERGGVLTMCHFGNWDMAASAALALGLRMTTVMATIIARPLTEMVALSRTVKGLELYTPRQAARGLLRALREGRFVALMSDIPEAGPTVTVPYCGGPVNFSAVPARLAMATGTPLFPVACWKENRHWRLVIHDAVPVEESDDESAVMARVAAVLEPHVRRHPEQWYPFHRVYADR
jgi:KDO2-lipid IV(A) lauroyltransferase